MSLADYHSRQQANAAQNELALRSVAPTALWLKLDGIRGNIEAALLHLDQAAKAEVRRELKKALETLSKLRP
jgi:hypothetical protein